MAVLMNYTLACGTCGHTKQVEVPACEGCGGMLLPAPAVPSDAALEARRLREWDADMERLAAETRALQRCDRVRRRVEVIIAECLTRRYLGAPVTGAVLDAMNAEAAAIAHDVLRVLEERPVGTPVLQWGGDFTRTLLITWRP